MEERIDKQHFTEVTKSLLYFLLGRGGGGVSGDEKTWYHVHTVSISAKLSTNRSNSYFSPQLFYL